MYYLFHYQIKNKKVGFPKTALNKVINTLHDKQISYQVIDEENKDFKRKNKYLQYINLGKQEYEKERKKQNLLEEIKKLDEKQSIELYHIIERYIFEQ